jgi:hypothetical protein
MSGPAPVVSELPLVEAPVSPCVALPVPAVVSAPPELDNDGSPVVGVDVLPSALLLLLLLLLLLPPVTPPPAESPQARVRNRRA